MRTTLIRDTLENCCLDCTRSDYLANERPATAYARGIINGLVTVLMAQGADFESAIAQIREISRDSEPSGPNGPFDIRAVPHQWQDEWCIQQAN